MNLAFTHPAYVLPACLAALVPLVLGLWSQSRPAPSLKVIGQRPWLLGLGGSLMVLGLGLGLAEPRGGQPEAPRLTVHVLVDASRSMTVPDAGGRTRWKAATAVLDQVWRTPLPDVRFGLDLLTGDAIPLMPPGEDRTLLRESLQVVTPGDIGAAGSGFAKALQQVAAQVEPGSPAVILVLSDGEETWEPRDQALARAVTTLTQRHLPLYAMAFGDPAPQPVAGAEGAEPAVTRADPAFLERLATLSGGRVLKDAPEVTSTLEGLAQGRVPLPAKRSHLPAHPEWGAWLALGGLALWALGAGRPTARWRLAFALLLIPSPRAEAALPMPPSVQAWLAQSALDRGDVAAARRWRPDGDKPLHRLIAAQVDLKSGQPSAALSTLAPLLGQGVPRPVPTWRAPALLLAARAQMNAGRPLDAIDLLERLLREVPGHPEAVHNLQSLLANNPPPPPKPPKPPPPPPKPKQNAREDEQEGLKQRLPQRKRPPAGIRDL